MSGPAPASPRRRARTILGAAAVILAVVVLAVWNVAVREKSRASRGLEPMGLGPLWFYAGIVAFFAVLGLVLWAVQRAKAR